MSTELGEDHRASVCWGSMRWCPGVGNTVAQY